MNRTLAATVVTGLLAATGGLDCPPDEACPDIGLVTRARSVGALGCA